MKNSTKPIDVKLKQLELDLKVCFLLSCFVNEVNNYYIFSLH